MIRIRPAAPQDVPDILGLIRELAEYERAADAVLATVEGLADCLFPVGRDPLAFCHVADVEGQVAGIAIWYVTFSTWEGQHGLYLEDLYVQPQHRGGGLGKALIAELAAEAVRRGFRRLEWWVLDWNAPAIDFYRSLSAVPMSDWIPYRLAGLALEDLARTRAAPA